jgi:hypothetical protein
MRAEVPVRAAAGLERAGEKKEKENEREREREIEKREESEGEIEEREKRKRERESKSWVGMRSRHVRERECIETEERAKWALCGCVRDTHVCTRSALRVYRVRLWRRSPTW